MAFTAQDVKALREATECGMLDCKKALIETDGDMEKAIELLRAEDGIRDHCVTGVQTCALPI